MTRLLALAAALAACILFPTTALADISGMRAAYWPLDDTGDGTELAANGGFEVDAGGHSAAAGFFTNPATIVARDTSAAHTGSASGVVTVPGLTAYEGARYRITYPFTKGRRYRFSVWVRSDLATNNVNVALGTTGSNNAGASNGPTTLNGTWKQLTGTWVPNADYGSADLGVYLPAQASAGTTFHVDDISVTEAELVANPGFEADAEGYAGTQGYFTQPATVARATDAARTGTASGKVTVPGATGYEGARYRISFAFKSKRRYRFAVWVRSAPGSSATNNVNAALGSSSGDNAGASNGPTALSSTWKELTGTWVPQADSGSADLGIYLPGQASAGTSFHVDDVSVTEIASAREAIGGQHGVYQTGHTLGQTGATLDAGTAALLNGSTGRITTAYNPFATGVARTFEGWAKRGTEATDDALFAGDAAVGYPVLRARAYPNDGDLRFNPNTTGAGQDFTGVLPDPGVWFHWALVWDGATGVAKLYVNGVYKGSKAFSYGFSGSPGNLEFGAEGGTANPFNGHLDEVAVYNRALTSREVGELYDELPSCDVTAAPGTTLDTLGELYTALGEGQKGCLRSGTEYTTVGLSGDNSLYITKRGISIRSYPGERATINGRIVVRAAPLAPANAPLEGKPTAVRRLTIDGENAPSGHLPFVFDQTDPNVALNAELTDSEVFNPNGICVGSDNGHLTYGIRIERNRIHDCEPSNNHNHGVYLVKARNALIKHNVIYDNGDRGIQLWPDSDGTTIVGNILDGSRSNLHYGGDAGSASDNNVAYSNILTNPRECCSSSDGPGPFNFYTRWPGPVGTGNELRDSCSYSTLSGYSGTPSGSGIDQRQGGVSVSGDIWVTDPGYENRAAKDFTVSTGTCAPYAPPVSVTKP